MSINLETLNPSFLFVGGAQRRRPVLFRGGPHFAYLTLFHTHARTHASNDAASLHRAADTRRDKVDRALCCWKGKKCRAEKPLKSAPSLHIIRPFQG